jgi:hypothetical protein
MCNETLNHSYFDFTILLKLVHPIFGVNESFILYTRTESYYYLRITLMIFKF